MSFACRCLCCYSSPLLSFSLLFYVSSANYTLCFLGAFLTVFDDLYDLISLQLLIYFSVFMLYVTALFTSAPTNGIAHLMATEREERMWTQNEKSNLIEKFFTFNFYLLSFLDASSAFLKFFPFACSSLSHSCPFSAGSNVNRPLWAHEREKEQEKGVEKRGCLAPNELNKFALALTILICFLSLLFF